MKKESKKQAARPKRGEDLKRKVCRHRNRIEKKKEEKTSKEKCADTEIQKRRRPQRKVCRHRK